MINKLHAWNAQTCLLIISLVAIAINLRPSVASIGPLLPSIRQDIPLTFAHASLLTMLPVLAMGAGMFFAQRISRLIGEHQTVTVSLLAIGLAISFRSYANSANALIASAVVAGAGGSVDTSVDANNHKANV
jgi:CP family cyanate transporter-like MFS transporter